MPTPITHLCFALLCFYVCVCLCESQDSNGQLSLTPAIGMSAKPVQTMHNYHVIKIVSGNEHLVCLTNGRDIFTLGTTMKCRLYNVVMCKFQRGISSVQHLVTIFNCIEPFPTFSHLTSCC